MKTIIFPTILLLSLSMPAWTEEPEPSVTVVIDNQEWPGHTWVYGTCSDKSIFLSFGPQDTEKRIERIYTESTSLYETNKETARRTFRVTAKQCADMFSAIESAQGGKYNLLTNNCTTEVLDVLKAGGIIIPKGDQQFVPVNMGIISPAEMEKRLNEFVNPTEPKAQPPAPITPPPPKKEVYDGPRGLSDRADRAIERVHKEREVKEVEPKEVDPPDPIEIRGLASDK